MLTVSQSDFQANMKDISAKLEAEGGIMQVTYHGRAKFLVLSARGLNSALKNKISRENVRDIFKNS